MGGGGTPPSCCRLGGRPAQGTVQAPTVAEERRASPGRPSGHALRGRHSGPAACHRGRAHHTGPCSEGTTLGLQPLGRGMRLGEAPVLLGSTQSGALHWADSGSHGNLAASPSWWPKRTQSPAEATTATVTVQGAERGRVSRWGPAEAPPHRPGPPTAGPSQVTASLSHKH